MNLVQSTINGFTTINSNLSHLCFYFILTSYYAFIASPLLALVLANFFKLSVFLNIHELLLLLSSCFVDGVEIPTVAVSSSYFTIYFPLLKQWVF